MKNNIFYSYRQICHYFETNNKNYSHRQLKFFIDYLDRTCKFVMKYNELINNKIE